MKVIHTEQCLNTVSAGTAYAYFVATRVGASIGNGLALFFTFGAVDSLTNPRFLSIAALHFAGSVVGTVGGYTAGALAYAIGSNLDSILSAPLRGVDFMFKPTNQSSLSD